MLTEPARGGTVNFADGNVSIAQVDISTTRSYAVMGTTAPGAGTWTVGYCVNTSSPGFLEIGSTNGWAMVLQ